MGMMPWEQYSKLGLAVLIKFYNSAVSTSSTKSIFVNYSSYVK